MYRKYIRKTKIPLGKAVQAFVSSKINISHDTPLPTSFLVIVLVLDFLNVV
jgi:hypothetical protein